MSIYADMLARRIAAEDVDNITVPITLDRKASQRFTLAAAAVADAEVALTEATGDAAKGRARKALVAAKKECDAAEQELRAAVIHLELRPLSQAEYRALEVAGKAASRVDLGLALVKAGFVRAIDHQGDTIPEVDSDTLPALLDSLSPAEAQMVTDPMLVASWGAVDFPTSSAASERTQR